MAFDRTRLRAALEATLNRPIVSHSEFLQELRRDFPRDDARLDELVEASKQSPEFLRALQSKRA